MILCPDAGIAYGYIKILFILSPGVITRYVKPQILKPLPEKDTLMTFK